MYQEVRQEGHSFNLLVHCDPSEHMITYDDVLGLVQVRAALDFLRHMAIFAEGQALHDLPLMPGL